MGSSFTPPLSPQNKNYGMQCPMLSAKNYAVKGKACHTANSSVGGSWSPIIKPLRHRGYVVGHINEVTPHQDRLLPWWVIVLLCRNTVSVCNQPPRPTQPPTLSRMGNEYQPNGCEALWLGSKGRYGSFHLWINVWVAGKAVWSVSTCAIPERLTDEQLITKRYTNKAYLTSLCTWIYHESDVWPVRRHTDGYLPSRRVLPLLTLACNHFLSHQGQEAELARVPAAWLHTKMVTHLSTWRCPLLHNCRKRTQQLNDLERHSRSSEMMLFDRSHISLPISGL